MTATRQRCDCELGLEEARTGDLPLVCAWCGDVTNRFYNVPLYYRGRRVGLRLPLCGSDRNHGRHRSIPLWCCLGGLILIVIAIFLIVMGTDLPPTGPVMLIMSAGGILELLGLVTMCVSFITYIVLTARGIRIRRFGGGRVTLMHVAPEFVEARRVYRHDRMHRDDSPGWWWLAPKNDGQDEAAPEIPLADEASHLMHLAAQEARESGHGYLGTRHVLLALCVIFTPARKTLQTLGLDAEQLRESVPAAQDNPPAVELPSTPAVRRALAQAAREAHSLNHPTIRAGHLLLALLREPENEAVQRLLELGIEPEAAKLRILRGDPLS